MRKFHSKVSSTSSISSFPWLSKQWARDCKAIEHISKEIYTLMMTTNMECEIQRAMDAFPLRKQHKI